jgi:Tol biopolymer transport system component
VSAWPVSAQEIRPGLALRQITHDGKSYTDRGTGFAPAGDHVSFFKQVSKTDRQLWVMQSDGSQAQAISPIGWPMICGWSPDATKIAYIFANKSDGNSEASVCVYDLSSGETRKTTGGFRRADFGEGEDAPPAWSPDGRHFAYHIVDHSTGISHLWTFRASDGEATKLGPNLQGTSSWDLTATWSPDSRWIAFLAFATKQEREKWGNREIWKCHGDGSELTQVTHELSQLGDPAWSPRGDWILYHSDKGRTPQERREGWNWDIWRVRPDGTEAKPVTQGSRSGTLGRWSYVHVKWLPDGSGAYFHGWGHDQFARGCVILLCDANGENVRQVMGPPGQDRWVMGYRKEASPDSAKLIRYAYEYVQRGEGDNAHQEEVDDVIKVLDIATGTLTDVARSRRGAAALRVYPYAESWAPDSRQILFTQGKVISWQQEQYEPDLYVLELPGAGAPTPTAPEPPPPAAEAPPEAVEVAPTAPAAVAAEAATYTLIQPKNMTAQQALEALPESDKAHAIVNAERNLLIVSGPPEAAQRIRDYLEPIDTPAPQVVMDVLVTEMSKTASRDLGLDWTYAKGHVGAELPFGEFGPGQVFYQGVERLDDKFFASLSALEEKGEVTIRANPRLTAVSGKTATMNIRRTKYYFYTQGYDQFGRPIIQQSDISADIGGKITPRVLGEGNLQVDVEVMVGNFAFTATSSLPDVTARQAATSVVLKDGETIVIGGLVLKQETRATSKTPVLGDLPLLGQLFRSSHRRVEENVLTILITPHLGTPAQVQPTQP